MAGTPDPLYTASGRLSHAIRSQEPDDVIHHLRRELAGAQLQRFLSRLLAAGTPPTDEQSREICDMLTSATKAAVSA